MFGFVRGVRGRAVVVVLVVAGLLGGVTASSVAAATKTTVTWNMSSLTAGQVKSLSAIATTNSHGVKTWSKTGSCTLWPTSRPTTLRMGQGASCTLTLKIAKSGKYRAKTSTKIITRESATTTTVAPTTTTVAPTTTTVALTCVPGASCAVGDTGPGGGTIFYVDLTRVEGSQYFEAACAGWSDGTCGGDDLTDPTAEWGCYGTPIIGADGTAIGDGEQNTTDIVTGCATAGIAAGRANDLVLGGQSDWFLPSKDELNEMYIQLTAIGGISPDFYWSSSEYTNYRAWSQYFGHGYQGYYAKDDPEPVRPVRAFTPSDDPNPPTTTTTTTTTTVALRCANGASCAVGDTGPGGGTIFYVDLTRLEFSQYFEAAPAATEVSRTWATGWNQWSDLQAWETGMVQGIFNTDEIVRQKNFVSNVAATSAAVYCRSLSTGGKTDWFLPSKDELNEMYIQRTAIGGFSTLVYWSSSAEFYRYNAYHSRAWSQYFDDRYGTQGHYAKNSSLRVRCVRYFQLRKTL